MMTKMMIDQDDQYRLMTLTMSRDLVNTALHAFVVSSCGFILTNVYIIINHVHA